MNIEEINKSLSEVNFLDYNIFADRDEAGGLFLCAFYWKTDKNSGNYDKVFCQRMPIMENPNKNTLLSYAYRCLYNSLKWRLNERFSALNNG